MTQLGHNISNLSLPFFPGGGFFLGGGFGCEPSIDIVGPG